MKHYAVTFTANPRRFPREKVSIQRTIYSTSRGTKFLYSIHLCRHYANITNLRIYER